MASLKGDVANESVQHRELSSSIAKDVLEPLVTLREGSEMVTRVVSGVLTHWPTESWCCLSGMREFGEPPFATNSCGYKRRDSATILGRLEG